MNYGELKAYVLADAHRPDLAAHVESFIRRAEGLIARKLRATAMDASTLLTDALRIEAGRGIYTLPRGVIQVRRVMLEGRPLEPVSIGTIARLRRLRAVRNYCELGRRIEFGGVPAAGAELELDYIGRLEPLLNDADENALLTEHEDVYVHAAKFYVYQHSQDRELAQDELDLLLGAIDDLNAELQRKAGGAGAAPMYDFGGGGGY